MLAKSMTGKDVDGVILNAYGPSPSASKKVQGGGNMMEVEKILDDSLRMAAENVIMAYHPSLSEIPIDKKKIESSFLREGGEGAMGAFKGALFEAIVTRLIKQPQEKGKSRSSTLDVNLGHPTAGPRTRDLFGIPKTDKAGFADLKSSWSSGNRSKIVEQIIKNFGPSGMLKVTSAAQGYIPNFAALGDSVEREAAAGVPLGSIRVGRSSRLAGPNNPAGLGITNTRDEPRGLKDVVGASRGYVPNFAALDFVGLGLRTQKNAVVKLTSTMENLTAKYQKEIIDLAKKDLTDKEMDMAQKKLSASMNKEAAEMGISSNSRKKMTAEMQRESAELAASKPGTGGFMSRTGGRMNTFMKGTGGMGVGLGLTMGLPMIAGGIEQAGGPAEASMGLTGAGTGAALGMIAGPWGSAIGAAIGGLVGFARGLNETEMSFEEIQKTASDFKKTSQEQKSAGEGFIKAQQDLVSSTSQQELEDAQKRLAENFEKIKGTQLEASFAAAKGNIGEMQKAMEKFSTMLGAEETVFDFATRLGAFENDTEKLIERGFKHGFERFQRKGA